MPNFLPNVADHLSKVQESLRKLEVMPSELPRGLGSTDYAQIIATVASSNSAALTAITGLSISPTLSSVRTYKVSAWLNLVNTTVANARMTGAILDGGAQIQGASVFGPTAAISWPVYLERILIAPTSGVHTFAGAYQSNSGGSVQCAASSNIVCHIKCEDIGPA